MPDIVEIVRNTIEEYRLLPIEGEVVVAVSGGSDSLCLLHLLHSLCGPDKLYPGVRLRVAHLNHQLRDEESAREAEEVAQLAAAWELPVVIGSIDVPALARREQRSLEDAARVARYRFLREVARGGRIAVAHHADDQVETLLLHWLRGGGIASMVGLQPLQQDIIRPLLAITHADTQAYCAAHGLVPLEDASNTDTRFLRNRIRHELLPLLEAINPGFRATQLRTAEVMQADVAWIEAQVDTSWSEVVISEQEGRIRLRRSALCNLPLSIQRHLLRRVSARLSDGQSPLELRHYKLIEQLVRLHNQGRELEQHMPGRLRVLRSGEEITFERLDDVRQTTPEHIAVILPIPGQVVVPGTGWMAFAEVLTEKQAQEVRQVVRMGDWRSLATTPNVVYIDGDRVDTTLIVRTRQSGDRIQPLGMAHGKKVQDILVDKHIARSERDRIPLFFSEGSSVWLGGICIDEHVRLTATTRRIIRLSLVSF
jgi:tRNA(Ile)-lysidine synthase